MLQPWTLIIAAHAITASASVVLGAFNIIRPTKGDRLHKAVGRTWAGLMLFVAAGSFFIGGGSGYVQPLGIFLHALAAWTIISITLGIRYARKRNIQAHRGFMIGTYCGLLGAMVGVIVVPTRRVPSYFRAYPLAMTIIALGIVALSVLIIQGMAVYISIRKK